MTVGVDDVSEKLNGLVNLLQIVGIDGVDPNALVAEQKRLASGKKDGSSAATGTTAQSTDSKILEIIKKLQLAQADSPEILQALQSPELLALASLAAQNKAPAPAPSLEDVMEDEDDNYPKIGPGYSDEVSVISEMSTPTVMTKQNVNEEEYYKEVSGGPLPMSIGGGGRPPTSIGAGRGKSRNLLASVANRGALAKGGGAAAQRRANHQNTMAKLEEPEKDEKKPKSQKGKGKKGSDKKKKKKDPDDKSKSSKGSKGDGIDWGTAGDDSGWPSFDKFETTFGEDPFGTSAGGKTETVVDADGFFTSDVFANVDPFTQQAPAAAASSNSSTASSSKKDGKKKKPKKAKDDGQGTRIRTEKPKEKTKSRRRRASIGM